MPSTEIEDRELLEAASSGDRAALDTLAKRIAPRVKRLARALAAGRPAWEDAAQQSLLEILGSTHTFDGRSSFERWADRITARTTLRLLSRERSVSLTRDPEREVDDLAVDPPGSHDVASDVQRFLARLSLERRVAIVLHHVAGYSVEEVAAISGVPTDTAKSRLLTARRELRAMIRRDSRPALTLVKGGT
ncbi:MAG: RNA polymerase sigma factor [Polyangiaceae bacterium]|nr:RNA polymerase sigma factor [Polyangiaceae bacterium]